MANEDKRRKPPVVELYPWRTGSTVVVDVALQTVDGQKITSVRIPDKARHGTRLHLPDGSDLRVRVLFWRSALHGVVAAIVLAGMITGAVAVPLLLAVSWTLLLACRRYTTRATGLVANTRRGQRQPEARGFRYYLCKFGILYSTARVRLYGQNLTRCRTVISAGRLQLGEPEAPMTDDVGLDRAVREAQSLVREGVLEVDSKRFTWCVDASIGIAVAMSGFSLSPWVGLVVGAGSAAAQAIIEPGRRAATVRDSSQRRLQDLARAVAGSVDVTVW